MSDPQKLRRHIIQDLFYAGWFPSILLIGILVSALSIVYVTHLTRAKVAAYDQLLMERANLEVEGRNQILEEYALSEHTRIEELSKTELGMTRPDTEREIVVSQP